MGLPSYGQSGPIWLFVCLSWPDLDGGDTRTQYEARTSMSRNEMKIDQIHPTVLSVCVCFLGLFGVYQ
jgi:hypothetical protein